MATPGDEQRKYKFTTNNGQFFEELKVQQRTEESKDHSDTLKIKNSEIIIKAAEILVYMSLNSSWKINPNGPPYVDLYEVHSKLTQNPNWKAHNLIQTSLGS